MEAIKEAKGHYETVKEYTKEVPTYDMDGNVIGTESVITGRELKWVWDDPEEIKNQLRKDREQLLVAFDKWEKAVIRGRENDDEIIMQWYEDLKELKETAFINIPARITYYWGKKE